MRGSELSNDAAPTATAQEIAAAIDVITRHRLAALAALPDAIDWDDYPDLGEHDWERIVERFKAIAPPFPTEAEYDAAYRLLSARADHGTGA